MEGWIKYHRSFRDHWIYKTKKPKTYREAWEDILLIVNFEAKKVLIRGVLYDCDRGQSLLSIDSWSKEFNWSIQQVRTFFRLLENDKMITTEGLQYTTRLTVCNYDIYQDKITDGQQPDESKNNEPITDEQQPDQQTHNKPITTTKESKESKEERKKRKKDNIPPELLEVEKYFDENGYSQNAANKFFKYYSVANWKDSKGNKVISWKQKAQSVWFKDENKKINPQKPVFVC